MRVIVLLLLFASWVQASDKKAEKKTGPRFTVSKETTYFTEPLDKEGYIDYIAAINERKRMGIKPEENVAALLFEAIGPKSDGINLPSRFFELLGTKRPPDKGAYFVDLMSYSKPRLTKEDWEKWYRDGDEVIERPWKSKDYPFFAQWLKSNETALKIVTLASRRSGNFVPLVIHPKRLPQGLQAAIWAGSQETRDFTQALAIRAMLHLGEGHIEESWQDLLTCHRLARIKARDGAWYAHLVAVAIESIACAGDIAFLANSKIDVEGLRQRSQELRKLPPMRSFADTLDTFERCHWLEFVALTQRQGPEHLRPFLSVFHGNIDERQFMLAERDFANLDWDAVLKLVNQRFDHLVALIRDRKDPFRKELSKLAKEKRTSKELLTILFNPDESPKKRGECLAEFPFTIQYSAVDKLAKSEDRLEQLRHNVQIAFALEVYKRKQGNYPGTLEALVPEYLKEVPNDVFNGKPLSYRKTADGYVLYSVGANRIDEQGRHDNEVLGDDPAVWMPPRKREE